MSCVSEGPNCKLRLFPLDFDHLANSVYLWLLTTVEALSNGNTLVGTVGDEGAFPRACDSHHSNQDIARLRMEIDRSCVFFHTAHSKEPQSYV